MRFVIQEFSLISTLFFVVCPVDKVLSWSININPSVASRGADKDALAVDPTIALQEYLDGAGAIRFCQIGSTKYGRGLVAKRDMEPGEIAVRIPLSETILVEQSNLDTEKSCIDDAWAGQLAQQLVERQKLHTAYCEALPPPPPTPARGDWSIEALQTLEDESMLREIEDAREWRNKQWELFGISDGALGDQQRFLDAIDLVSSRTIRCGSNFMLVPFVDMANHASREQGGGFFQLSDNNEAVELRIGDRGIRKGEEVCLDYGDRSNEDWLIHYGFLPDRNSIESVFLPDSHHRVTWDDVRSVNESLKEECQALLKDSSTSLQDDLETLRRLEMNDDITMVLALQYRIARKTLLSAVAGTKASSAFSSAFL